MKKISPIFIGIVGPSGAGKSTICKYLEAKSDDFQRVRLDNYFKLPRTFPKKHGFPNWELPSNLKFKELLADLKKLKAGKIVRTKSFPKAKGGKREPVTLHPKKYILVEGFMLFKDKAMRDFLEHKIYLDIPPEKILERRMIRFGNDHESQYDLKVAIPEFLKYGITQKKDANYVVDATQTQAKVRKDVVSIIKKIK